MPGTIWLDLAPGVGIEIDRAEALTMDRRGFAKLYRRNVVSATRREARAWADQQIALRESVLRAQGDLAAR